MKTSRISRLRVFIPFAFGYFLSYHYRVVNAVLAPDLVADLELGPDILGLLTAVYFITFAAFQLPLGVLLDRFGPRKIESFLLIIAGFGAFVFAKADSASGLVVGRALIGFGVSACLMAAFTAFVNWFPRERLPLINGIQMAAGGLGALAATAPVEVALQVTDWRGVFMALAAFTLAVAVAVFLVVPEGKADIRAEGPAEQLRGIVNVFTSPVFWRIAPWTMVSHATFLAIQGLWSGPWLRDVARLDRMQVAHVLFLIAASMVSGFIFLGALADRLRRFGMKPLTLNVFGMVVFMLVQLLIVLEWSTFAVPLWVLFGVFGSTSILSYAVLTQSFPPHLAGRVNTGLNLLVFVGAFACQWGTGAIIGLWPTAADGGYAPRAYQAGFGLMLGLQVITLAWFIVTGVRGREKKAFISSRRV
jgi:MFS family permease